MSPNGRGQCVLCLSLSHTLRPHPRCSCRAHARVREPHPNNTASVSASWRPMIPFPFLSFLLCPLALKCDGQAGARTPAFTDTAVQHRAQQAAQGVFSLNPICDAEERLACAHATTTRFDHGGGPGLSARPESSVGSVKRSSSSASLRRKRANGTHSARVVVVASNEPRPFARERRLAAAVVGVVAADRQP